MQRLDVSNLEKSPTAEKDGRGPPPAEPSSDDVDRFVSALLRIDRVAAARILTEASSGSSLDEVIAALVVPSLERIGDDWVRGRVALSDVYMSSRICEDVMMSAFRRVNFRKRAQPKVAIASLLDHHNLGKRLVQLALGSSGYEALDFGHGLTVEALARKVRETRVDVLLISTLMLSSALKVKDLTESIERTESRPMIVVGGAPFRFDAELWREVGADAMGASASDALRILDGFQERAHAPR